MDDWTLQKDLLADALRKWRVFLFLLGDQTLLALCQRGTSQTGLSLSGIWNICHTTRGCLSSLFNGLLAANWVCFPRRSCTLYPQTDAFPAAFPLHHHTHRHTQTHTDANTRSRAPATHQFLLRPSRTKNGNDINQKAIQRVISFIPYGFT